MLDAGRARLPYWRVGQGPDLVFVHGWPFDARGWRHAVAALSGRYTCHLIDLPLAGFSEWDDQTPVGIAAFSSALLGAMDLMDLGDRPVGFVGHDSGGSVARIAAAAMTDRLAGLVLGNTEIPYHPSLLLRLFSWSGKLPGFEPLLGWVLGSRIGREGLQATAPSNTDVLHGPLDDLFFQRLARNRRARAGAARTLRHVHVRDFDLAGPAHAKITAPVLLIWGGRDRFFPLRDARTMRHTFGTEASLVVVEDAGLMVHEERPDAFNAALGQHFDACFERRAASAGTVSGVASPVS